MEHTGHRIRVLLVNGRFGEREPTRVAIVTMGLTVAGAEKELLGLPLSLKGCGHESALISVLLSLAFEDVLVACRRRWSMAGWPVADGARRGTPP